MSFVSETFALGNDIETVRFNKSIFDQKYNKIYKQIWKKNVFKKLLYYERPTGSRFHRLGGFGLGWGWGGGLRNGKSEVS